MGSAVAAPSLLEKLQYLLQVQVFGQTLHNCQTFSCGSLLEV
jgi:hypothetical protein